MQRLGVVVAKDEEENVKLAKDAHVGVDAR